MPFFEDDAVALYDGDALRWYAAWDVPVTIVSDGAYGVGGFSGDPPTPEGLAEWYRPHIRAWTERATPRTTLWFWNTEIGWATVHPLLKEMGWTYRNCHIWNKGIAHIAGNSNGKTLRKFPVTTEVCVQYVKQATFEADGKALDMQGWLRHEWMRSGLPFYEANEACGVKNAASRKYLTSDHLWYYPPPDAFARLARYANEHGDEAGKPYFSVDGETPLSKEEWKRMRARFNFENGVTNVWTEPAVRGSERVKKAHKCVHGNQKPLKLLKRCIAASSDEGDVVWEPFGGLCSVALAARDLGRRCFSAELDEDFLEVAVERLRNHAPLFTAQP